MGFINITITRADIEMNLNLLIYMGITAPKHGFVLKKERADTTVINLTVFD